MRNAVKAEVLVPSVVFSSLCVGLAFAPDSLVREFALNRTAVRTGEWWRLWTAHLVHFSPRHALFDAGAALLLGRVAETFLGKRDVAMALLLGAPLLSIAMLLILPNLMDYRGASGLATLLGVMAGVGLWHSRPKFRAPTACLGVLFLAKVASDAFGVPMTLTNLPTNVSIAWQVHLIGVALGLAVSILMCKVDYPAENAATVSRCLG